MRAVEFLLSPGRFLDKDQALPLHQSLRKVGVGVQSGHTQSSENDWRTVHHSDPPLCTAEANLLSTASIVNLSPGGDGFGLVNVSLLPSSREHQNIVKAGGAILQFHNCKDRRSAARNRAADAHHETLTDEFVFEVPL